MNTLKFVDLGLPSGKLWAAENIKDENGNEVYFSFDKAVETFGKNLPSKEDWKELFDNSSYSWNEERKGYDVIGPNGNSIFLPAAGYRSGVSVSDVGSDGYYWSSSVYDENVAYNVLFYDRYLHPQLIGYRRNGFAVRLTRKEPETIHHNITVPRKCFKEYREGLFFFITKSTSSSASEKKFAEAMLEKFSENKEEIEITKVEAVSLIELYNTIKEKDLFENTIIECYREQQIGAMWEFVWPIAKAYGLKID